MFDKSKAKKAFKRYTEQFDMENPLIFLKARHTCCVAAFCEEISLSLDMGREDRDLAWLLGLLHDIGRFEQVRSYGTFLDAVSVDHAEFGADLLFKTGLVSAFEQEGLPSDWKQISETAIRQHNKLAVDDTIPERTRRFCDLLRDADKLDIFRVIWEIPAKDRIGRGGAHLLTEGGEASEAVMDCVRARRCVPRELRTNAFEGRICQGCMAFELVFPVSRRIAEREGFLEKLLSGLDPFGEPLFDEAQMGQLAILREEIRRAFKADAGALKMMNP